ncbi:MAG: choice-of-anchor D domain-containing protein [Bryobacteraceae bacterium]
MRLVLFLLALPAWGQLWFYAGEARIETRHSLGAAPAGGALDARLRVRNAGNEPVVITSLAAAGAGFSVTEAPRLPTSLGPGGAFEFTVRFQPPAEGAYSAVLRANTSTVILSAEGVAAPPALLEQDGALQPLGAVLDFGTVERDASARRRVVLENRSGREISVQIGVSGAGFRLQDAPAQLALAAGARHVFEVLCSSPAAGAMAGALDAAGRRVALRALAVEPPLPQPELKVYLERPESAAQGRVEVPLAAVSRTRAEGDLRIEFFPAAGLGEDAAVVFATGGRLLPVSVTEGERAARISGLASMGFQTGSTAGEIRLTLRLGEFTQRQSVTIVPAPVAFASVSAARSPGGLELQITGLDNSRSISRLTFRFYGRAGSLISNIETDASEVFRRYFVLPAARGQFLLKAAFPVTGPAVEIAAWEAEMQSFAGVSVTKRMTLPD